MSSKNITVAFKPIESITPRDINPTFDPGTLDAYVYFSGYHAANDAINNTVLLSREENGNMTSIALSRDLPPQSPLSLTPCPPIGTAMIILSCE